MLINWNPNVGLMMAVLELILFICIDYEKKPKLNSKVDFYMC